MQLFIKRLFDMTVAGAALFALSPVLLVIALLVRMRLGSPVLFRQARIGRAEQPFTMLKFRTMLHGDAPDHERLTPFGQWLRATSLDELPELWNILVGDMSIVGPRPLLPRYIPFYQEREKLRHRMRPGLTGLAQVNGRNATSWDARLAYDAEYVERFSLALDLAILWKTLLVVARRHGISAEGEATMHALDDERRGTHG